MKGGVLLLCAGTVLQLILVATAKDTHESMFAGWMKEHKKEYRNKEEYIYRLKNFIDSVQTVKEHNAGNSTYTLGLNALADMSWEEFKATHLLSTPQNCSATKGSYKRRNAAIPKSVDWRSKGVVSGIKNQGSCGSCWTFSTTGAMEAHVAITYNLHLNLSEQQLVDCAQAFNNHGCSGGLPSQAFEYIHYNDGLMNEKDYPYTAKDGKCKFDRSKAKVFVGRVMNITQYDEASLVEAIAVAGPVSIAYQVAKDFRLYKKGVYTSKVCQSSPDEVNHAVLAVGYDVTDDGVPYYIVKNSWGTSFGMDGYFWIARGKNMCGLADCASYPVVTNR